MTEEEKRKIIEEYEKQKVIEEYERNKNNQQPILSEEEKENKGGFLTGAIIVFFLLLIVVSPIIIGQFFKDTAVGKHKTADLNNIHIAQSQDLINIKFVITPNVDITNLAIKFNFTDENHNILLSRTENFGNVVKGANYEVTYSALEFSWKDMTKVSYVHYIFVSGEISS